MKNKTFLFASVSVIVMAIIIISSLVIPQYLSAGREEIICAAKLIEANYIYSNWILIFDNGVVLKQHDNMEVGSFFIIGKEYNIVKARRGYKARLAQTSF